MYNIIFCMMPYFFGDKKISFFQWDLVTVPFSMLLGTYNRTQNKVDNGTQNNNKVERDA